MRLAHNCEDRAANKDILGNIRNNIYKHTGNNNEKEFVKKEVYGVFGGRKGKRNGVLIL